MRLFITKLIGYYKYIKYFKKLGVDKNVIIGHRAKIVYKVGLGENKLLVGNNSIILGVLHYEGLSGEIDIGNGTYIGAGTHLVSCKKIFIGNNVMISFNVWIYDNNAHSLRQDFRAEDIKLMILNYKKARSLEYNKNWDVVKKDDIIIEDDVWIGFNSIILPGAHIKRGAIISAGSVIRGVIPAGSVYKGSNNSGYHEI